MHMYIAIFEIKYKKMFWHKYKPLKSNQWYDSHDCHSPSLHKTRMAPHQNTKSCGLKTAWPVNIGFDSTPTNMKGNSITCKPIIQQ